MLASFARCLSPILCSLALSCRVLGAELPEPLTLAAALGRADAPLPERLEAESRLAAARATRLEADSREGVRLELAGRLRLGQPLDNAYSRNDSALTLLAKRRLSDFGRSRAARQAAEAETEAARLLERWTRWQRRLEILDAYLGVLEADRAFRVADERMAVRYVRLDAMRDRHRLGKASDVDLLDQESRYQEARIARMQAEQAQRLARARLAEALGLPGQLPGELAEAPDPDPSWFRLPPLERLEAQVLSSHPRLRALAAGVQAAEQRVAEAAATERPDLALEAGTGAYSRAFGSRNRWHAGLVLSVPLHTGGSRDAALARARAERLAARAALEAARREARLELRSLVEEIALLQARREAAKVRLDYRDLYLERSRALYELEVETDLGDAMIELNKALQEQEAVRYDLLRARARLDAWLDKPPLEEVLQ